MGRKLACLAVGLWILGLIGANDAFGLIIERRISGPSSGVEERPDGSIDLGSSDLEIPYENSGRGNKQIVGIRFTDVPIPRDARIMEAWVQFEVDETKDGTLPVNLVIEGERSPDPVTFTTDPYNVTSRAKTAARVQWSVLPWTIVQEQDVNQRSADITPILEEIINQDGWASGNALVLIFSDDPANPSQGIRCAESSGVPTGAPMLHVRIFSPIATEPNPPDGTRNITPMLLEWVPGDDIELHEVYFGTNPTPGPDDLKGRQPLTMYWLGPNLAPGVTYYWRIDGVEADGTATHVGPVWSFTTASLTAHTPNPANGAKWVGVSVDPSWTAGIGALMHDVYFGTDREAVANGMGDTFRGTQPVLSFDPGPLAENTTYYWRVDEIEQDGTTRHDGHVWRFTTVGPGGGIEGQYYHYSGGGAPTPPQAAFETLVLTRMDARIDFIFGSGSPDPKVNNDSFAIKWVGDVDVAFSEPYTFSSNTDDGLKLWVNDRLVIENWTLHGDTIDVGTPIELASDQQYPIEMWYFENSSGAVVQLFWQSPSTPRQLIPQAALSLPLRARNSKPRNGSTDVTQHPLLRWTAGRAAMQHDVYFGEDANAVADATTATADIYRGRQELDEVSLDPDALAWGKTYYWRIDEVNEANADSPWKGPLWSFTTADFVVVDDFESYTDDEGNRIYETWIDGWTNDTGSQAGYTDAPFAEQTIIHAGDQAMPMAYDNASSPWYSEIERSWDTPQDWTANGVDTLRLHVRGQTANVAAQLYVTVEDGAGHSGTVSHSDTAVVTTTKWAEWKVPLNEFSAAGVDLTGVVKIRIGAGNRAAPTPGGAGLIYIDDIRVTKP